jgi:hypothetical protein
MAERERKWAYFTEEGWPPGQGLIPPKTGRLATTLLTSPLNVHEALGSRRKNKRQDRLGVVARGARICNQTSVAGNTARNHLPGWTPVTFVIMPARLPRFSDLACHVPKRSQTTSSYLDEGRFSFSLSVLMT